MIRRLLFAALCGVGVLTLAAGPAGAYPATAGEGNVSCTVWPQPPGAIFNPEFGILMDYKVVVRCPVSVQAVATDYGYAYNSGYKDEGGSPYMPINSDTVDQYWQANQTYILNTYGSCGGFLSTAPDGQYNIVDVVTMASIQVDGVSSLSASDWVGSNCFSVAGPEGTAYAE